MIKCRDCKFFEKNENRDVGCCEVVFSVLTKNADAKELSQVSGTYGCEQGKVKRSFVVTKSTKCGTFQKGDHIVFYKTGDVGCFEAGGWLSQADFQKIKEDVSYE